MDTRTLTRILADGAPSHEQFLSTDEGAVQLGRVLAFPRDRVWVRSMMNQSFDGALTGEDGTSASLGNPDDFFMLTILRALPDVLVVGAETVRSEDYRRPSGRAAVRAERLRPGGAEYPALAILTRSGDLPDSVEPEWPTLLIVPPGSEDDVAERAGFPGDQVIGADAPQAIIAALTGRGYRAIQVEGGSHVLGQFLAAEAIDETVWSHSAVTVGGDGPRIASGPDHRTSWDICDVWAGTEALTVRAQRRDTKGHS